MESKNTIKLRIKDFLIALEYLFWLIFDFSKFKPIRKEKIKKVLFVHSGAIGELLVSTPAVKAVKEQLNAEVHYMVSPGKENILAGNPNISKTVTLGDFKHNFEVMKKEKYDLVIALWPGSLKVGFAAFLAGVRYRVGCFKMVSEGPAFFFTRRWWPLKLRKQHALQSNLDMIRLIGLDNKNPEIEFYYSKKDDEKAKKFLKENKIEKFAIIHPGFGGSGRDRAYSRYWPPEFYAKLIEYIIKNYKMQVVFTGIKEESEFIEQIIGEIDKKLRKKVHNSAGKFNLAELGALISKSKLLIAPDTSSVHIASAFNVKVIDFMSFSNDVQWHPYQKKENYRTFIHPYFSKGGASKEKFNEKLIDVKIAINELLRE